MRGGLNTYGYVGGNPLGWIDPFGLVEGSPSNLAKRFAIAYWAKLQNGNTAFSQSSVIAPGYSYDSMFGPQYPAQSNKCSALVCEAAALYNADTAVTVPDGRGGTVERCATAAELAEGDVPNWRLLGPEETPEPGDIAAASFPNPVPNVTGHTAIVVDDGMGGITTMGAHATQAGPAGDNFPSIPRYRRYTGE
jgi:hypothetical protein